MFSRENCTHFLLWSLSGFMLQTQINRSMRLELSDATVYLIYRPQSYRKVMFLHLSVILFTGGSQGGLCQGDPPDRNPHTVRAHGTHPTGMHSCSDSYYKQNTYRSMRLELNDAAVYLIQIHATGISK